MLALLEKIASAFWSTIWRVVALFTPFFTQSRYLKSIGRGLAWIVHIVFVIGIFVGLFWVNWYFEVDRYIKSPILRNAGLQNFWLPILWGLVYILAWLGWWLWRLLGPEEDLIEFPDIEQAWDEAVRSLHQNGIELTDAPLFFLLGRPKAEEEATFAAAQLQLKVSGAPTRPDAPLHVYAGREAIFVTCPGASLLGRQAAILAGEVAPETGGAVTTEDALDKTLRADDAAGFKDVQQVFARAKAQGRDHTQLTDAEREEIRGLLAQEKSEQAQERVRKARPHLLKNANEVELLTARLRYLCKLIARDRKPFCPVNGLLVLVPFAALDSDDDANQTGLIYQQDVATVRKSLQVNCPMFALVCDLETASGFREFMERFPTEQRQRRLGQRLPLAPDLAEGETFASVVDRGAQWVCNILFPTYVYRLFRVESTGTDEAAGIVRGNVKLYQLMYQMRERRVRLSRLLTRAIGGEQRGPALFGGCYIAGTGREPRHEQAFVAGVFRRLSENQNFISWTDEAMEEEVKLESWTKRGYTGIAVFAALVIGVLVYVLGIRNG